jgi:hypothetical protein
VSFEQLLAVHTAQDAENFRALKEDVVELKKEVVALRADVSVIKQQLGQWKGFFGGIVFVLSALWAVITWGLPWLRG